MPGLSGLEICRMLRMSPRWQQLPVVFVTATADLASRLSAFRAGADDYLAKPIVVPELLARIRVRLEQTRLLRERAERCPLTGTLLRRPLLEALAARLSEARRRGQQLSLALLDLDYFKQVNDRHGHLAGDRVLLGFGKLLGARFRASDLRGRWGGEEFVVALPDEDESTARGVLERVLLEFAAMEFEGDGGERFSASFSGGIACFPGDGERVDDLIRVADARLYRAKAAGRANLVGSGAIR
jgi:diguanylate cyclase (GGDEF)-like protein